MPKALVSSDLLENYTFENYVQDFGKDYTGDEYKKRKSTFLKNLEDVLSHNKDEKNLWEKGV